MRTSERLKDLMSRRPRGSLNDWEIHYRSAFRDPLSREVLIDIFQSLGLFAPIMTQEDIALHNEAISILQKLGVLYDGPDQHMKARNNHDVIDVLLNVHVGETNGNADAN